MLSRLVRQTSERLTAAGFTREDAAVTRIRDWNARLPPSVCGWPTCAWHGDMPYTP